MSTVVAKIIAQEERRDTHAKCGRRGREAERWAVDRYGRVEGKEEGGGKERQKRGQKKKEAR